MANDMGMAIVDTNWQNFLLPGSELPPDVSFMVKDGESGGYKSIRAHSQLLAGSSPVFRAQFFGPMQEAGKVVEVKDTTSEAFGTMMGYILIFYQTLENIVTNHILILSPIGFMYF